MDIKLRKAQKKLLGIFAREAKSFALCGGTALELYYLGHRFSVDLDFFSPRYDIKEIGYLVKAFEKSFKAPIKLEATFNTLERAQVRFYSIPIKGADRILKIDFIQDVIFDKPKIKSFEGVRVYSVDHLYLFKLMAITGTSSEIDEIGRQITKGRQQVRDVFDVYMLSKKIKPLSKVLQEASPQIQRGIIHWYRTYSRQDYKLALLDLDIYDKNFSPRDMVVHIDKEIGKFIKKITQ